MTTKQIYIFAKYGRKGASTRLRTLQYLPSLIESGWSYKINHLFNDDYIEALYHKKNKFSIAIIGYLKRFFSLFKLRKDELVYIEKELFPFFPALFEMLLYIKKINYVVDYDDAIFHRYDDHHNPLVRLLFKKKINYVMRYANTVIVGNDYLADKAKSVGAQNIVVIPTAINLDRYQTKQKIARDRICVGWIGTPNTFKYIKSIEDVLESLQKRLGIKLLLIGITKNNKLDINQSLYDIKAWSEETEIDDIHDIDIGIMPLIDEPIERGKCGYKIIQYMACECPVVASPVGVNKNIIQHGINGYLANNSVEWSYYLEQLIKNQTARIEFGLMGRKLIENNYNLSVTFPVLKKTLNYAQGT